jgi:Ser/Thr protein kinase RdoA (MazF antagonist)
LAQAALADYEVRPVRLTLLAHAENSTFRVEARDGERYVLRVHRVTGTPWHPPRDAAEVRSEMSWLAALRREPDLRVPEPMPNRDGGLVTIAANEGVPEARVCVLFRWVDGRFLDASLAPQHLERVGQFTARLHQHAETFAPPEGFVRWQRVDTSADVDAYVVGDIAASFGQDDAAIAMTVIEQSRRAQRELGAGPDAFGLIHGDLHQENYLFHRGAVGAIDFDDCGWGHFLYDLAVTLSEVSYRPHYEALRAALLRGYRSVRALPPEQEQYLETFQALRLLQLTLWFIEQRDHPAFADWEEEARSLLDEVRASVRGDPNRL